MSACKHLLRWFVLLHPLCGFAQSPQASPSNLYLHATSTWHARHNLGAHFVLLHHFDNSFASCSQSWRQAGSFVYGSTNVAWGNFTDYVTGVWDGKSHFDEIQLTVDGMEFEVTRGAYYFVPSLTYLDYLKKKIEAAIDAGVEGICLEQPFFWSQAGYSDGFKREWENFYESEWQDPQQSVAVRYQAEQLKFELELRAVSELLVHAKIYAHKHNREMRCYVSALSSMQYARAGKVGPQAELMYIPECDGIVANVAAEVKSVPYAGVSRVRPFETAWLDFAIFAQAARGHDKQLIFGIEGGGAAFVENEKDFQTRMLAALFYPECSYYAFLTPVEQLFHVTGTNGHVRSSEVAITQLLILQHALQGMPGEPIVWDIGERGIGILMSDAIMLQRALPDTGDVDLATFYGLALPLLKHGIFVQPLLLENLSRPDYLLGYKILFLSYRAMKPQQPQWHERLATWVRTGGTLIFVDDERDALNQASGWWSEPSYDCARPSEHLFQLLGLRGGPKPGHNKAGLGAVIYVDKNPAAFARAASAPEEVLALAASAMPHARSLKTQNYFKLHRGPYLVAHVFDETTNSSVLHLRGDWIDLFNTALPRISNKSLSPGESALLFDLSKRDSTKTRVLAASATISPIRRRGAQHVFIATGPAQTQARVVLCVPGGEVPISAVSNGLAVSLQKRWQSNLTWLEFEQQAMPVEIRIGKE